MGVSMLVVDYPELLKSVGEVEQRLQQLTIACKFFLSTYVAQFDLNQKSLSQQQRNYTSPRTRRSLTVGTLVAILAEPSSRIWRS